MSEALHCSGFANYLSQEALVGALPKNQNNPQHVPFGLYAEQLSGAAFTAARKFNLRSWLYRILPSVNHTDFNPYPANPYLLSPPFATQTPPNQMRWQPLPVPKTATDFIDGWITWLGHGDVSQHQGAAIHLYAANKNMQNRFFYNADGELLIVAQTGECLFKTEFGHLTLIPGEMLVIPRGVKFQVDILSDYARGYICENFGMPFTLPDLSIVGPNCLAQERHFQAPVAAYEDKSGDYLLLTKFQGKLWQASLDHSPLNVVAWHGNYYPYKYDLSLFTVINSVSVDHPDPSIFTVLSSPSTTHGYANVDFVIFPERWLTMQHTMRLPYFHRNVMSEYMGLIKGSYDAKDAQAEKGFVAGGGSLHNCMSAHGPDSQSYQKAISAELKPEYYANTLAFMFESYAAWQPSKFALETDLLEKNYLACWKLPKTFKA